MRHEPELQHVHYVWVDAICVNQENIEKRKATIYRMNDIYIHATVILAVLDLHAFHVASATTANHDVMVTIQQYRRYLYYLLLGTPEAHQLLNKIDDAWRQQLQQQHQDSSDVQRGCFRPLGLFNKKPNKAIHEYKYQLAWQQRHMEVTQSVNFLQSLMEDWSNRTWMISEYHIAKRKSGKLKFWYNQLSCAELHGHCFFEFDFTTTANGPPPAGHQQQQVLTSLTDKFNTSMRRQLTKRTVLEMMLQTKATKTDDRFYSIIPLAPKYKHHIKDRHSVSTWGISDMIGVRLKLLEWMDTNDQLNLLYSAPQPQRGVPFLPTFATTLKTIKPGLGKLISSNNNKKVCCNFDLGDPNSVRLLRQQDESGGGDGGHHLDLLWLAPRHYNTPHPSSQAINIRGDHSLLWDGIGLDPTGKLDAVSIPLFIDDNDIPDDDGQTMDPFSKSGLLASDLQLVGSWEKNRWIVYRFCSEYKKGKIYPSDMYQINDLHHQQQQQQQEYSNGFCIY